MCASLGGRSEGSDVQDYETLLYEEREGVAIVTLNRPEVHNAFNLAMQHELRDLWGSLRTNDDVRVVVLTGAGEKAFCSGIDRDESIQRGYLDRAEDEEPQAGRSGLVSTPFMYNDTGTNINPKQNDMWKPVIAAVNGIACGGALYMLGEADIIIAAEHATFFDPHVSYGLVADAIAEAPVLAIQATVRAIWMAHELSRRDALAQVSNYVTLGTRLENVEAGQQAFKAPRRKWRLR